MDEILSAVTNPYALAAFAVVAVLVYFGRTRSPTWRRRVFALAAVCLVGALVIAMVDVTSKSTQNTITQSTEGDASPNVAGNNNVVSTGD